MTLVDILVVLQKRMNIVNGRRSMPRARKRMKQFR